ncbi:MAG: 4-hydroxy-tetrahydrodipicolinate synthase [Nitrosomonadales bacterium]
MFKGSAVAIVSPMNPDGSLDFDSLKNLIDFHIVNKSDAIVIVGTSGESPTLTFEEHIQLVKFTVEYVNKKIPVIAGTGANSTAEAIYLTKEAKIVGADAALIVVPYYNKPPQEGLYQHFKMINDSVDIPQILYNVPSRTVVDLTDETILELSRLKNIVGIKDATGDINRLKNIIDKVDKDFLLYSGDDLTSCEFLKLGGHGIISVTANLEPLKMHQMCMHIANQKFEEADKIDREVQHLHKNLFVEANPIPVKWVLNKKGLIKNGIRLPLVELAKKYHSLFEGYL